jgi:hypothetical protein
MQDRHQKLFFGLWLVKIPTFHQIKVRQPIGIQDSMQTVIRTSRRLDSFLNEAAQNFEVFSIFKSEIKKSKTYSG